MEHRISEKVFSDGQKYHEDFYLDFTGSSPDQIFMTRGVGFAAWSGNYRNTVPENASADSLELITDGCFQLTDGQQQVKVKKGDLILLGFGKRLTLKACPEGKKKCVFFLYSSGIKSFLTDLFQGGNVLFEVGNETTESLFDAVYREVEAENPDMGETVYRLLLHLKRNVMHRKYPQILESLLQKIEKEPERDYSREELAGMAGTSISTLNRLFQQYLHCSPGEYRIKCRIAMAQRMLDSHYMTVKEVAAACGYSSCAFFCREFKRKTGRTPGSLLK